MKRFIGSALITLAVAAPAMAGGLDRSGQGLGVLFEDGNAFNFSIGAVNPNVGSPLSATSDSTPAYTQFSLGYKHQLNDDLSLAVIFDQPFGASVNYTDGPYAGVMAEVNSSAVTGLARYRFGNGFAAHVGVRAQQVSGDVIAPVGILSVTSDWGIGGLVGVSWERPDIAARVSLTYNSQISHTLSGSENFAPVSFPASTPQSVNLDFRTGIAANTLLFGSIRWVDWSSFTITSPTANYVAYTDDVITYSAGVGRKFNDNWSGAITLGYEHMTGTPGTPFAPTDGYYSLGLGATYTTGGTKITGGARYVWFGDANVLPGPVPFTGNSTVAVGISVTTSF